MLRTGDGSIDTSIRHVEAYLHDQNIDPPGLYTLYRNYMEFMDYTVDVSADFVSELLLGLIAIKAAVVVAKPDTKPHEGADAIVWFRGPDYSLVVDMDTYVLLQLYFVFGPRPSTVIEPNDSMVKRLDRTKTKGIFMSLH